MKSNVLWMNVWGFVAVCIAVGCKSEMKKPESSVMVDEEAVVVETSVMSDSATVVTYTGKLPSADCPGIVTTLVLKWTHQPDNGKNMYELKEEYIGKKTFLTDGEFNVERGYKDDNDATLYILNFRKPVKEQRYYVSFSNKPEVLHVLDSKKEMINSKLNYTLKEVKQ